MNQEVFDRLCRILWVPLALLAVTAGSFHYQAWGIEVNPYVIFEARLVISFLGAGCAAYYLGFYYLVRKYYDGDGKQKGLRRTAVLFFLGLLAFALGIMQTL